MALDAAQTDTANRVIQALAGPTAHLRDDQLAAVEQLVTPAARVLVVQATGWGKSAVYWVSTALLRGPAPGPPRRFPLLALMRDQVVAAERAGLRAATINSSNFDDWSAIEDAVRAGEVDVLLVSPSALRTRVSASRAVGTRGSRWRRAGPARHRRGPRDLRLGP